MSCGLLLWVPWLCLISLLFGTSDGSPVITGYGYPVMDKANKLLDVIQNEVLIPSIIDEIKWQASTTQPAGHVYENYSKHTVFPLLAISQQNHPSRPNTHEEEKFENGALRSWEVQNPDKRVMSPFGLNPKLDVPSKPELFNHLQPDVIKTGGMPISQSTSDDTNSVGQIANPRSSSPSKMASIFWLWPPKAVGSGYGMANSGYGSQYKNTNTSSSADADKSNGLHLFFEEVFKYHSKSSKPQAYDGANGFNHVNPERRPSTVYHSAPKKLLLRNYRKAWKMNPFWMGLPSFPHRYRLLNLNFSDTEKLRIPFIHIHNLKDSQRARRPMSPQRRSATYRRGPINMAQSSNYYQRGRYHQANTIYSPNYR